MRRGRNILCLTIVCVLLIIGCSEKKNTGVKISKNNAIDTVIKNEMDKSDAKTTEIIETPVLSTDPAETIRNKENEVAVNRKAKKKEKIAIDLTEMSSDMIYATVYQLMTEPDDYIGKTIRIKGTYAPSWYEDTKKYYHYAIIQDATACCSQGLEFVLQDDSLVYPEDYPKEGEEIIVVGTFETYTEEGDESLYCRLRNAIIESYSSGGE